MTRRLSSPWVVGGALALAAFFFRVLGHAGSGLWYDEIMTLVDYGRLPLRDLLTQYGTDNNHPLYSVTAWASLRVLGESAFALRLPAMLFGVASIIMLWRLGVQVTRGAEAIWATLLMLVSYHHIWFSQNARAYTMLLFFSLASTYFLFQMMDRFTWRSAVWYGLCVALATFAHQSALILVAAQAGVLVIRLGVPRLGEGTPRTRLAKPFLALLLAGALSLGVHSLILPDMLDSYRAEVQEQEEAVEVGLGESEAPWWSVVELRDSLWVPIQEVILSVGWGRIPGLIVLSVVGLALGVGMLDYFKTDWRLPTVLLLSGVMMTVVALAGGVALWPRYYFFLSGFLLLVLIRGGVRSLERLTHPFTSASGRSVLRLTHFTGAALVLASLFTLPRAYALPKQDYEGALAYVSRGETETPCVVVGLTIMPYTRYYAADCEPARSVRELQAHIGGRHGAHVLSTLPHMESDLPADLAELLDTRAKEVARFQGSLRGGDVVVYFVDAETLLHR